MTVAQNPKDQQPLHLNIRSANLHVTPEQFERLCIDNLDLRLELTQDGQLIIIFSAVVSEHAEAPAEKEASPQEERPNSHPTSSAKYNFVELIPEETVQRVAALERYQKSRQKIIDSLTPEELEVSNKQFEDMFKMLDESRG